MYTSEHVFSVCWVEFLYMSVRSSWFIVLLKFPISLLSSYLVVLSTIVSGIVKVPVIVVELFLLQFCHFLLHIFLLLVIRYINVCSY